MYERVGGAQIPQVSGFVYNGDSMCDQKNGVFTCLFLFFYFDLVDIMLETFWPMCNHLGFTFCALRFVSCVCACVFEFFVCVFEIAGVTWLSCALQLFISSNDASDGVKTWQYIRFTC